MNNLTWHIGRAKELLSQWYAQAAQFELKSVQGTRWQQFWMTSFYKRKVLHCKTAGLVWHDRYKMLLDCQRKI